MATPANGRWFFEGVPLGNRPPITFNASDRRSTVGGYPSARTIYTAPLIGSFGWLRTLVITGQVIADDGDFLTRLELETAIDAYCREQTKLIEDTWGRQHNVLDRKLGTLGYVTDIDTNESVGSVTVQDTTGAAFGTIQLAITPATLGIQVDDRVVITQDPDNGISEVGEIAKVITVETSYIEVVSRLTTLAGETPYSDYDDLVVMICEGVYEGYSYRDTTAGQSKTLAEAAFTQGGVNYTFEGIGEFARRAAILGSTYTPPNGILLAQAGVEYGDVMYGASE